MLVCGQKTLATARVCVVQLNKDIAHLSICFITDHYINNIFAHAEISMILGYTLYRSRELNKYVAKFDPVVNFFLAGVFL